MALPQVTQYKVMIYGKEDDRDIGRIIHLYSEKRIIGTCQFFTSRQVPMSSKRGSRFFLTFPVDAYPDVIDLLRNESPIYATFSESSGTGYLSTNKESVGEGDLVE